MSKKIAVAGTGYVGLSMAVLLAQHNEVVAVDIVQEKVDLINQRKGCLQHGLECHRQGQANDTFPKGNCRSHKNHLALILGAR